MASGSVVSSSLFLIYVAYRLFVGKVQVFNRSSMRRQWGAQAPVVFVFSQQQQRMYKVRWRTAGVPTAFSHMGGKVHRGVWVLASARRSAQARRPPPLPGGGVRSR